MSSNQSPDLPIDSYLLAIADGLHKAQAELSRLRAPGLPGERPVVYQLPYLDFELKMSFELRHDEEQMNRQLAGRPLGHSSSQSAETASVLKGRFVAVPANAGKPQHIVRSDAREFEGRSGMELVVEVGNAAGEMLEDANVEFNINREMALKVNAGRALASDTQLDRAAAKTRTNGKATTFLMVPSEPPGTVVPVTIDTVGETFHVLYRVPGAV